MMILQFLLAVSEQFGDAYLTHIMLPVFMVAVGDNADLTFFPSTFHSRIKGTALLILFWNPYRSLYHVCLLLDCRSATKNGCG